MGVAAVLIASVILGGSAAASGGPVRAARFKVMVNGLQIDDWAEHDHPSCGAWADGSGSEILHFKTTKPQSLTVRDEGSPLGPIFSAGPQPGGNLAVRVRLVRTGSLVYTLPPGQPPCGGSGNPVPPDCGTRNVHAFVGVAYGYLAHRNDLTLGPDFTVPTKVPGSPGKVLTRPGDPFGGGCPEEGTPYPNLLAAYGKLSPARLFSSARKLVVRVNLTTPGRVPSAGLTYATTIRWTLTLTR